MVKVLVVLVWYDEVGGFFILVFMNFIMGGVVVSFVLLGDFVFVEL